MIWYKLRIAFLAVPSLSVLLLVGPSPANAYTTPNVEAGRTRIQVTAIPAPDLNMCQAQVDGGVNSALFGGAAQPISVLFENLAAGIHTVAVACIDTKSAIDAFAVNIEVKPSDPILDAIDKAILGFGSSALTSDPTLR